MVDDARLSDRFLGLDEVIPLRGRGGPPCLPVTDHNPAMRRPVRASFRALAVVTMMIATVVATPAVARASETSPYVGWGYGQTETPRAAAMGGALRASAISTDALFFNPANMALARVYHLGAYALIWPRSSRQTYGLSAMDSVVSASRIAGGVAGNYTSQDVDGVNRSIWDFRGALAFPFSKVFYAGLGFRYLDVKQNGYPRDGTVTRPSAASSGLREDTIAKLITFDAGLTVRPVEEFLISVVGYNLTNQNNYFAPLMASAAMAYATKDYTFAFDYVADFSTYLETAHRLMAGGEVLVADAVPIRGGYQWDQGADTHALSIGLGYIAQEFAVEAAFRQSFYGEPISSVFVGVKYHLESVTAEE